MKTEIIAITDRSGSMATIQRDAEGGFNTFIEEQRKVAGEARVTSVIFDTQVETQYQGKPLADVPHFQLVPRGSTALNDAIGRTLNEQGKRIADEKWADLVIVLIITDGEENASREFSRERVAEMIKHAESNGWKFIFTAANQDAFASSRGYGIVSGQSVGFAANAAGVTRAYDTMSMSVASMRSGAAGVQP